MYALTEDGKGKKIEYQGLEDEQRLKKLKVSTNVEDYPVIGDIDYRGLHVSPCRFPHGGKRHAQMKAFEYLDAKYSKVETPPLLLFIDSDIELDRYAINHFVYELNRHAGVKREALTGLITCKTAGTYSIIRVLQDCEYIESQMMARNTEDYLGSVSCLPGALTMVRFNVLKRVAKTYFSEMEASDNVDFARCHLGEDRYLTHLIMESRKEKHRIGYCLAAKCKTEACEDFRTLLKQRRRWYLGTLANEIFMLTSPILWRQFPALNFLVSLQALKNGPLFLYVFISESLLGKGTLLTIGFAVLIFGPIWLFVSAFGISINRKKVIWAYPLIVLSLPIMSAMFQIYGMITFRTRTWGGPRANAAVEEGDLDDVEKLPKAQTPKDVSPKVKKQRKKRKSSRKGPETKSPRVGARSPRKGK
jgi:chitin synthase